MLWELRNHPLLIECNCQSNRRNRRFVLFFISTIRFTTFFLPIGNSEKDTFLCILWNSNQIWTNLLFDSPFLYCVDLNFKFYFFDCIRCALTSFSYFPVLFSTLFFFPINYFILYIDMASNCSHQSQFHSNHNLFKLNRM